jgi:FAD/FMN-containing dehydrogenase
LSALIAAVEAALPRQFPGARANIFGHVGDGNMHVNIIITSEQTREADIAARINRFVHDLVAVEHGSITAEHGVGQYRITELYHYASAVQTNLMERLKVALDPDGIMNPGKVLAVRERYGPH